VEVQKASEGSNKPSIDVIEACKLLEKAATFYKAMYTHGMHLQVQSAEREKVTYDSGIAASMLGRARGRYMSEVHH